MNCDNKPDRLVKVGKLLAEIIDKPPVLTPEDWKALSDNLEGSLYEGEEEGVFIDERFVETMRTLGKLD